MNVKLKIFLHIACLCLFLLGAVIIHTVLNSDYEMYDFFNISFRRIFLVDMGLLLIGIGFFLEFFLTFKPIEVNNEFA